MVLNVSTTVTTAANDKQPPRSEGAEQGQNQDVHHAQQCPEPAYGNVADHEEPEYIVWNVQ